VLQVLARHLLAAAAEGATLQSSGDGARGEQEQQQQRLQSGGGGGWQADEKGVAAAAAEVAMVCLGLQHGEIGEWWWVVTAAGRILKRLWASPSSAVHSHGTTTSLIRPFTIPLPQHAHHAHTPNTPTPISAG